MYAVIKALLETRKSEMPKILIIDDENILAEQLAENLTDDGFEARFESNPLHSLTTVSEFKPDLLIIDKIMPEKNGIEVIDELKASKLFQDIPIIMLTACKSKNDLLECFKHGVNDFMTKPFDYDELLARINANLVKESIRNKRVLNFNNIYIDTLAQLVQLDAEEIHLTLTEYKLLRLLVSNLNTVLSREELCKEALGSTNVIKRTIDVHMTSLRKKIGDNSVHLKTVRGVGYKLCS